ncbi:MAG: TolC family protein [Bacteroidota bacterium]|nr:TolC family protein [Bacteroidota bacterium]
MKNHPISIVSAIRMLQLLVLLFIILGISEKGNAQDSLSVYLKEAATNNPGIKAKYKQYLSALEMVPQVGALPDPEVSLGIFLKPNELNMGNQVADIRIMQMFPWAGSLKASKSEAALMAKAQYHSFVEERNQLFYRLKNTWYAIYKLQKEIKLTEDNLRILQSIERLTLVRYRSSGTASGTSLNNESALAEKTQSTSNNAMKGGQMGNNQPTPSVSSPMKVMPGPSMGTGSGMVDILRIKMERGELENKLSLLNDQKRPLLAEFNSYLNRNPVREVYTTDSLSISESDINDNIAADSIRANNPMLKMYEAETASNQAAVGKAQKMGYPMIGLGFDYMLLQKRMGSEIMNNGKDMVMPMMTVTLPIYRKKYKAMKKEAELKVEASKLQRLDTENQLLVNYQQNRTSKNDALRRVKLNKVQEQYALQSVQILRGSYQTSGKDLEEVLRMMRQLLDYRFQITEAIVDYHLAQAGIELLMAKSAE